MANHKKDLTGMRFGRLTVLYEAKPKIIPSGKTEIMWHCKCDCGNEIDILGRGLRQGNTKSCGCYRREFGHDKQKKYCNYNLCSDYGIGYTAKGEEFLFDLEDFEKVKNYCWHFNRQGYVVTKDESHNEIKLHRLIMDFPNCQVDHINKHKKSDNRKSNLRLATNAENCRNKSLRPENTSGSTGVSWHKGIGKWTAYIGVDNKVIYLGSFVHKEEAIKVRKRAEEDYFGKFSYDNSQKIYYGG